MERRVITSASLVPLAATSQGIAPASENLPQTELPVKLEELVV